MSDETIAAMQDILLASTAAGREVAGTCTLRPPTDEERAGAALEAAETWVLEDFRTTRLGEPSQVRVAVPGAGELSWHTHPGLRFSLAGFSDGDAQAVEATRRPLLVIGYTFAAPETLSWFAVVAGWQGIALTAAVQLALRAEASGRFDPRLSKIGVAARMLFPGGRWLPVRRLRAAPWRRALETGAFEVDRAMSVAANTANRWVAAAWSRVRERKL